MRILQTRSLFADVFGSNSIQTIYIRDDGETAVGEREVELAKARSATVPTTMASVPRPTIKSTWVTNISTILLNTVIVNREEDMRRSGTSDSPDF